ncbi:hypothetical protein V5O48_013937 [Marasmius crinis-equi]|uniref:Uncharacterized protein n=1 Tax=Marasmius crinis-equi TaxID=585013 RepID=A0ABR3EYP3_9AGAR
MKKIEQLRRVSPHLAQCAEDWLQFQGARRDTDALAHALRLKEYPGRGRTHIVVKKMAYEPKEKNVLDRFKAVAAGVFRIEDITDDLDRLMNFNPGESKDMIKEMLDDSGTEEGDSQSPHLIAMFLEDPRLAQLGIAGNISGLRLQNMKPISDWRSLMNRKGGPPAPLRLASGAKDAEYDAPSRPLRDETAVDSDHEVENSDHQRVIQDTWLLPLLQELFGVHQNAN